LDSRQSAHGLVALSQSRMTHVASPHTQQNFNSKLQNLTMEHEHKNNGGSGKVLDWMSIEDTDPSCASFGYDMSLITWSFCVPKTREDCRLWISRRLLAAVVTLLALGVFLSSGDTISSNVTPAVGVTVGTYSTPLQEFLSDLPPNALKMAQSNVSSSPQSKALVWLLEDELFHFHELYRLKQRYALVVMLYANYYGEGWLESSHNTSECTWLPWNDAIVCNGESRLIELNFDELFVSGSMPRELGLLSDLEVMTFLDYDTLSVGIFSELYVP
jgi:hypothetical protein